MIQGSYDIIVVGGGLGGSALAGTMAAKGARVLILERTTEFIDRVRGEQMHPWGVAEAKSLGIFDILEARCGHHLPWWDVYSAGERTTHRDLTATTPQQAPEFSFYHPGMQNVLLQFAVGAGAEVKRGATVKQVSTQKMPSVVVSQDGQAKEYSAKLVVGADGRNSLVRNSAGFTVERDPVKRLISGLLFENMPAPEDSSYLVSMPGSGKLGLFFPQGKGRVRVYLVRPSSTSQRLQGEADIPRFTGELIQLGAPATFFESAKPSGPLATFEGTDVWVRHPQKEGIVLIGDAAAANDPSFGCGLSLTLRDVRVLRDQLEHHADWEQGAQLYAEEHDRYYGILHTVTQWTSQMLYDTGPVADARRARALPLIAQDRTRAVDHLFSGPDKPVDETTRRRYFGEE